MAKTQFNNIEKRLSGGGANTPPLDMQQFIKLADKEKTKIASETPGEEFEIDLLQILSEWPTFKKLNPSKTYDDFLEEHGLLLRLSDGGSVVDLSGAKLEDLKATFRSLMGRDPKSAKELIRIIKLDLKGMDARGVPYGAF